VPSPAPTQSIVEGGIFGLVFLDSDSRQQDIAVGRHLLPSLCLKGMIYRLADTALEKRI
jgi:hypothetical protein